MTAQERKAHKDYMAGMPYKALAEKYSVSLGTIRSWVRRNKWKRGKGPPGNKNAKGSGSARKGNHNALKHGLYAKYLPAETLAIVQDIESMSSLDILWANIKMKFAAILRAQKIMYVAGPEDDTLLNESKKAVKIDSSGYRESHSELIQRRMAAIDKETRFLVAQSRAMGVLVSMIHEYEEQLRATELATEEQRARIDKLKAEVARLNKENGETGTGDQVVIIDDIPDVNDDE